MPPIHLPRAGHQGPNPVHPGTTSPVITPAQAPDHASYAIAGNVKGAVRARNTPCRESITCAMPRDSGPASSRTCPGATACSTTDLSSLLYYRPLKLGTLDLGSSDRAVLGALLTSKPGTSVSLRALFANSVAESENWADDAVRRARSVSRKAVENFEERGVNTLFIVQGMASWVVPQGGPRTSPAAPVLMCAAGLHRRGASEADFDLSLDGEWTVNDALLRFLAKEFNVSVSGEELLGSKLSDARLDETEVAEIFGDLRARAVPVPGFTIEQQLVVGNFMYRKMPMVADIEENLEALAGNDLIAAIAGDREAGESLRGEHTQRIDQSLPDTVPAADEYLVLDADSSQNAAVNAALAGESFVLQGPPGTGKSQTIANLIAAMMARGRSVLFVAEKRAAIDAVTKRLTNVGLDGFVMDFHGGTLRRRDLARRLDESLEAIGGTPPTDDENLHDRLEDSRSELSGYTEALHTERRPWGVSFYDVHTRLLEVRRNHTADTPPVTFPSDVLAQLDSGTVRDVRRDLSDWSDLAASLVSGDSPWAGAVVSTIDDVRRAQHSLGVLAETVPEAGRRCGELLLELGLEAPCSVAACGDLIELLGDLDKFASHHGMMVFENDLDSLEADLAPAVGGLRASGARLFGGRYRAARRAVIKSSAAGAKLRGKVALDLVNKARAAAERWKTLGGKGQPHLAGDLTPFAAAHGATREPLDHLAALLPGHRLEDGTHEELAATIGDLLADEGTLHRLPRISEIEERCATAGAGILLERVRSGALASSGLTAAFELAWLESVRREVLLADGRLSGFDADRQNRLVAEFRSADVEHLTSTPARVRRRLAEHAIEVRNGHPDQDTLIRREAAKKTRHLPLRQLFERAPDVLTTVRPCWAMSPLDVAQTLPPRPLFDLVVFDEGSQVLPCDAIPALLRAPRAMVAGDSRQLPPTTFFDGTDDDFEADDDAELGAFESILNVMDALLSRRPLTWHYRSANERLIAFSNRNIYHGGLTTFPGAVGDGCLSFELVEHRPGAPVETRSNPDEVRRVVDLMIDHARRRPDETLGVIAMGRYHADRIEEVLRQRLDAECSPDLEAFFDEIAPERAFVKNLERVQGDERDAIILSVGYGKNDRGQVVYRFGPLNAEGGERRLNVAVTRARKRMTLVASFSHAEMDPSRSSAEGARLLRGYLKYAESGGTDLSGGDTVEPLNPFEVDVLDKLTAAGLNVVPQYGCSGYRIDFAVRHPSRPASFVLAVEADGASYHSSHTARDRDRLRQDHLERLGWRFCRIWSTDWFSNHRPEVERVLDAYRRAVHEVDSGRIPFRDGGGRRGGTRAGAAVGHSVRDRATSGISQQAAAPTADQRGAGPRLPRNTPITEHSQESLVRLAKWVMSDGLLRTDEQIFEEMFERLGYGRRGSRIKEALFDAIRSARGASADGRETNDV